VVRFLGILAGTLALAAPAHASLHLVEVGRFEAPTYVAAPASEPGTSTPSSRPAASNASPAAASRRPSTSAVWCSRAASTRGGYFFGDYRSGRVWSLRIVDGKATSVRREPFDVASLSSFGEDARGELYLASLQGPVYRLAG
jgi:hypothetical protein